MNQVQRAYNGLGQMTREWQATGGSVSTSTTPSVQYAYSEMASGANHSRLTSVTYPSGYVLTYTYASGLNGTISRLSSLSDATGTLESYDYLGAGTVVRRSHSQPGVDLTFLGTGPGSGGDQYVGLDAFGRVVDQNWAGGSASTDAFTYTYDRDGNRLTKGNGVNAAFDESYAYDGLNQLTDFTRGTLTQAWDYDAVGNMDSVTTNSTTQTRAANRQNEVTSVSGATTPAYDANGNMTTDETGRQFVYDAWNRLVAVKSSGGTTLKTYAYDGLNRRVQEVVGSATTDLYYSSQWQVLEERVSGGTTARYVWSPVYVDAMVLQDRATVTPGTLDERVWVQQDANFNVTAITDGSGAVLERYAYDPYGSVTVMNASWTVLSGSAYDWKYLHQGGRLDGVSGLYYFRNRDYSPTLGRWTTVDPKRFSAGSVNFFIYLGDCPINRLDPNGLQAQTLPVANGSFVFDMTPYPQATGRFGVFGSISFVPDKKVCPKCKAIDLVQIVKISLANGGDYDWSNTDEALREKVKTKEHKDKDPKKSIEGGWFVDHKAEGKKQGGHSSIYYRDHFNGRGSATGSNDRANPATATIIDAPESNDPAVTSFKFETCARCADKSLNPFRSFSTPYYGCISWAFTKQNGVAVLEKVTASATPSATFEAAVKVYDKFYGN